MQRAASRDISKSGYEGGRQDRVGADIQENTGPESIDYLEYLSDMVLELRLMSEKTGTPTLAGILELAYREARLQVELRRAG